MKDIILERLSKMEDLEQRRLLKDIMSGFFSNLTDYQEASNRNLEARIFNEIEDSEKKYNIYFTVCDKNNVDPVDDFLYPVFPEDMEEITFDMNTILEGLRKNVDVRLFTLFMKCDYPTIKKLLLSKKSYPGVIITDEREYRIKVSLEQNPKYFNRIQELYDVFQKNTTPWKTVNHPYSNKFFEVVLTECEGMMGENEEIREIEISLGEYDKYKMPAVVPLWNIRKIGLKCEGFPMPAVDRVNYEHVLSLKKLGTENGYLIDAKEHIIKFIMRMEEKLIIVSPEEKAGIWDVLKVNQYYNDSYQKNEYEMVTNSRKQSFINKFAGKQSAIIRTKGEIARIVNSFEASRYFSLEDIEIRQSKSVNATTYDMNSFITDDIRVGNDKKIMNLKFRTSDYDSFIVHDILSFLVSEVQMYFPEYECEGELI
ncbi:MAG: normocyte-binding protein [Clostridiaceae bacterium]|nr:normocyte-binding protein [Clostridiaceae bacterium]